MFQEWQMPSSSLNIWKTDRRARLREVSNQCAASGAVLPPNPYLEEENIRGYILLLSAHFQGFCRDLYSESAQIIAATVGSSLRILFQQQFTAGRKLDSGNPSLENPNRDFNRFGFTLSLDAADPANPPRITQLGLLNRWRNVAAHHGSLLQGGLPAHPTIQTWENSCDGLATSLDQIMYNRIKAILGTSPWIP
jgi:hypothetical protein